MNASLELQRTDRYLVRDVIAVGGMASVHIGIHEGALGFSRIVAVKRLHAHLASDERFVAMLLDEARLVSRIRHVNVVPTIDVLESDGEVFVIMEYVRGASLSRLVDRVQEAAALVPLEMAVPIVGGALRGLHAAHEASSLDGKALGIVHRDVSPQNILVGIGGVPRVIDFGVAHALGRSGTTRSGEFKGKLAYAAPEQLGDGVATRRTDVYAMGIVLWELITGERLFRRETDVETFGRALRGDVESPLDAHARSKRMRANRTKEAVAALTPIVMHALSREPARRYDTAAEMAQALDLLPAAPVVEIGRWVQELARAELARELDIVTRVEEEVAGRSRRRSAATTVAPPRKDAARTPSTLRQLGTPSQVWIQLRPMTFVALALSAAAGAAFGATLVSPAAPPASPSPPVSPVDTSLPAADASTVE